MDFKEKEQIVENIAIKLREKISDNIDLTDGSVLRTIVESIAAELDLQYWQMEQIYNGSFIDTAYGDDLTELVKILGIERTPPAYANGYVTFRRSAPALDDYIIPEGTIVETREDLDGNSISYIVKNNVILNKGDMEVDAYIECMEPGVIGNISENNIITINNPPLGIESVINKEPIIGGREEESDDSLRERAKKVLDTTGLGTVEAITNQISQVSGIEKVSVFDMRRGIGTVDILVLGDIVPLPESKIRELNEVINSVKAAGIDVLLYEPDVININVELKVYINENIPLDSVYSDIYSAIINYVNNLDIGETLILNQLRKHILNSNSNIIDIEIITPIKNIIIKDDEIIKSGNIQIYE